MTEGLRCFSTRTVAAGLLALALTACERAPDRHAPDAAGTAAPVSVVPDPRPDHAVPIGPIRDAPIATSEELTRRYDRFEGQLLSQGYLRTDGGGLDGIDAGRLSANFLRIALYDEYVPGASGQFVAQESTSRLRRWETPVRIGLEFGASVSEPQRAADRTTVDELAGVLGAASGHSVALSEGAGNFTVFVVDETERLALAPRLGELVPGLSEPVIRSILDILPTTFCLAVAFSSPESPSTYVRSVAIIRAEHPQVLRQSCFHEEIAQGLGLANDSRAARPTIFSDDEEFAALTEQDRLMLRMLYDPRLHPGMDLAEAGPVAEAIALELLPPPVTTAAADIPVEPEPAEPDE